MSRTCGEAANIGASMSPFNYSAPAEGLYEEKPPESYLADVTEMFGCKSLARAKVTRPILCHRMYLEQGIDVLDWGLGSCFRIPPKLKAGQV